MRLAYPQRTHVRRLLNVFSRSALQRSSAHSMASGRSNIAAVLQKVAPGVTDEAFIL